LDSRKDTLCGWTEEKWTMLGGEVENLMNLGVARKFVFGFTLVNMENCTITRAIQLFAT